MKYLVAILDSTKTVIIKNSIHTGWNEVERTCDEYKENPRYCGYFVYIIDIGNINNIIKVEQLPKEEKLVNA